MEKILDKKHLDGWIAALSGWEVHAPALQDGIWAYRPVSGPVKLDHTNTTQPPKGFAFPQREVFFSYEQIKGEPPRLIQKPLDAKQRAVFGVRPCDGRGVVRMDRVFSDHVEDSFYLERRRNMAYIGLACNRPPRSDCFCLSVGGSPVSSDGFDILLTDLGGSYFVAAANDTGKALINAAADLFTDPTNAERKQLEQVHTDAVAQPQRTVNNVAEVPAKLKTRFDSPLWDELARACIGCGICTFLCPTCHCFDINDEQTGSSPMRGNRVRTWDNCQFPDFTMHTSGHNPRDTTGSRLRQRVNHKFQYFFDNFEMIQCTGCGRCVSDCPVGIDIVSVVNKVVEHEHAG